MRAALIPLLSTLLSVTLACDDDPSSPTVSVRIVSPSGGDPLSEATFSSVRVDVLQDGRPLTSVSEALDGEVDIPIEINSLFLETRVRVTLEGSQTWVGAPPRFVPISSAGLVRIVVGPAGECAIVEDAELPSARDQAAAIRVDTFVLSAAGEEAGGRSRAAEFVDLLRFFSGELPDLTVGGAATGASIGDAKALLITAEGTLIYDLGEAEMRETPFTRLHAGGDETSTAIERPNGTTVVGGGTEATWVWDNERQYTSAVMGMRTRPAGAAFGAEVLVVAGGEPFAELLDPNGEDIVVIEHEDGERFGALIARDDDALWLLGGTDGSGASRSDTWSILGCPDACAVVDAPAWEGAAPTAVLGDLVLAGDSIYRVSFGAGVWQRQLAWTLGARRDGGLLVELESGVVVVVGGSDAGGARADVEMCWPDELRPL